MSSSMIQFPGKKEDRVFFGSENCFRSVLSAAHAGKSSDNQFHDFFSRAQINDIEQLLKNRANVKKPSWSVRRIRDGEEDCYNNAIAGLCYGTAALLQRSDELLHQARQSLSQLKSLPHAQETPAGDPKQTELRPPAAQGDPQRDDIEDFLGGPKSAADLILLDLWNSSKSSKDPAPNVCRCPLAFVANSPASLLRITVQCVPSPWSVITPNLYYGGSLLWGVSDVKGVPAVPGWKAITDVWSGLKTFCPGVRVSIGIEEFNQDQHISTPILDGDSIQAATALAIWDAWHRTKLAELRKAGIENLDARLLDFELDPKAIVTAALQMQGSLNTWTLKWVDGVKEKFDAAHKLGLHLGVMAREKPESAGREPASLLLPSCDADTFPELCECMARTGPVERAYRKRNIDEWHREFLDEAEALKFIAERDRASTEQET